MAVSFNGLWAKFMHMCPRVLDDSKPVISRIQHGMGSRKVVSHKLAQFLSKAHLVVDLAGSV
jgi:hypothetical protein